MIIIKATEQYANPVGVAEKINLPFTNIYNTLCHPYRVDSILSLNICDNNVGPLGFEVRFFRYPKLLLLISGQNPERSVAREDHLCYYRWYQNIYTRNYKTTVVYRVWAYYAVYKFSWLALFKRSFSSSVRAL